MCMLTYQYRFNLPLTPLWFSPQGPSDTFCSPKKCSGRIGLQSLKLETANKWLGANDAYKRECVKW